MAFKRPWLTRLSDVKRRNTIDLREPLLEEVCGDPEQVRGAVEPEVVLPGWLVLPQVPPRQPAGDLRLAQAVHRRAQVHHARGVGLGVLIPDGRGYLYSP